jgi:hypothetical protein
MGQIGSWPLNYDLRDPNAVWSTIDPTPADVRDTSSSRARYPRPAISSIDVLPVWNALDHQTYGPAGKGANPFWTAGNLTRSGIAIWDTGVSDNPDVAGQVAAVISAGQERGSAEAFPDQFMSLAYTDGDDAAYDTALRKLGGKGAGISLTTDRVRRKLFPLDDSGSLEASPAPTGCDGHGTEVASVAAATANNGQGLAGVGWNVPILALRPWRAWDDGKTRTVADALTLQSFHSVDVTDETLVDQLAAAKALGVPVVNMSFGGQLFENRTFTIGEGLDQRQSTKTVVTHPAVVEAFAHAFSSDTMLGVAAAGDGARYGSGRDGSGAALGTGAADAAEAPCGLRTLAANVGYVELAGRPRPFPVTPDVLRNLDLICVGASRTTQPGLAPTSGYGDTSVDLAAPGVSVPVAVRPPDGGDPTSWYRLASGTSLAAAQVSGAAALLLEVGARASARTIATALRQGARADISLLGRVRYGQLDVACAARWLVDNRPDEVLVRLDRGALNAATNGLCGKRVSTVYTTRWSFPESYFNPGQTFNNDPKNPLLRRQTTGTKLVENVLDSKLFEQQALAEQQRLLPPGSTWPAGEIAFFQIGRGGFDKPVAPPNRPIYNFNETYSDLPLFGKPATCPVNTAIVSVDLRWHDAIHPTGYVYGFSPRSAQAGPSGTRSLVFNVAVIKPWFIGAVGDKLQVDVTMRCAILPDLG